jgi:hypothetical protein
MPAIEELLSEYFEEQKKVDKVEKEIAILKKSCIDSGKRIKEIGQSLHTILKDASCSNMLYEVENKKYLISKDKSEGSYGRNRYSVKIEEISTIKDVKTNLAIGKLAGKGVRATKGIKRLII